MLFVAALAIASAACAREEVLDVLEPTKSGLDALVEDIQAEVVNENQEGN